MITHQYSDGSQGFEYEVGDRVIVHDTVHGGWHTEGPANSEKCIVSHVYTKENWRIRTILVKYSKDWGACTCYPWHLSPHSETLTKATVVLE